MNQGPSQHFSWVELGVTSPATLSPGELSSIQLLCSTVLEPWREIVGPLRVTDGRWTPGQVVYGRPPKSQHAWDVSERGAAAVDVAPISIALMRAWWALKGLPFDQAILYQSFSSHIHVSTGPRMRRQTLEAKQGVDGGVLYVPVSL